MVQQIIMPISEVADRYTIALLKYRRLPDEDRQALKRQVLYYRAGLDRTNLKLRRLLVNLFRINRALWDTEGCIRRGELDDPQYYATVGQLALRVRDLNKQRCSIKNTIVALTSDGFAEVKCNYGGAMSNVNANQH